MDARRQFRYYQPMQKHIPIFEQVTAYLKATGQTPSAFGLAATQDGNLLRRLVGNRTVARVDKALAYMANNPPKRKGSK